MGSQGSGERRDRGTAENGRNGARKHFARTLAVLVAALAIVAAIPVVASLATRGHGHVSRGHRPKGFSAKDYPRIPRSLIRGAARGRSPRRSSAAVRRRSRTAFHGRSSRRALRLLRTRFPQVKRIPGSATPKLPPGARVEGYLGDYTTRITMPKSLERQLVVSPLPVRDRNSAGRKARVSLGLHKVGTAFEPVNPLVDAAFPQRLGDGVAVGEEGVRVRPAGSAAAAATAISSSDQLLYPNTATDSDTLVTAAPTGVELFTQIRSAQAPEAQAFEFDLPAGASLQATADGGAEVVRGPDRLVLVLPPSAEDSDGQSVPARYAVSGNRLTITVSHHTGSWTYPLLVDPLIESWGSRPAWRDSWFYNPDMDSYGWFFADSPAGAFTSSDYGLSMKSYGVGVGRGLYVYAPPNTKLPFVSYGEWLWRAPGQTTFIPRVDFGLMYRDARAADDDSVIVDGIYSEQKRFFTGAHAFAGRIAGQSDTVRAGDGYPFANQRYGNMALFSLGLVTGRKRSTWTTAISAARPSISTTPRRRRSRASTPSRRQVGSTPTARTRRSRRTTRASASRRSTSRQGPRPAAVRRPTSRSAAATASTSARTTRPDTRPTRASTCRTGRAP